MEACSLTCSDEGNGIQPAKTERNRKGVGWLSLCAFHALLHAACFSIYAIPIVRSYRRNHAAVALRDSKHGMPGVAGAHRSLPHDPVLDESHICSADNLDVNGDSSLARIFTNDYWGRPMNSTSSHKSWRPLTVLSFRHLQSRQLWPWALSTEGEDIKHRDLLVHRLLNVLTHAAAAELVSVLAVKLVIAPHQWYSLRYWVVRAASKLLFCLHPTHVEVTANAANRPHLLAVLFGVLLADVDQPFVVFLAALVSGFLCAETFLFTVVPAAVTMAATVYLRRYHYRPLPVRRRRATDPSAIASPSLLRQTLFVVVKVLPRCLVLAGAAVLYYLGRLRLDWLSIPDGLIRPAENPFYEFTGTHRVRNYAFVLSIHVAKAWDLDFIGFSHEYGRECIRPVSTWDDERLLVPAAQVVVLFFLPVLWFALRGPPAAGASAVASGKSRGAVFSEGFVLWAVNLSWMATLFPVAGIVKVGTFIADRIVVASTVSVCILVSNAISQWMLIKPVHSNGRAAHDSKRISYPRSFAGLNPLKLCLVLFVGGLMWRRIHMRTLQWMDSISLLQSSLRTCPRFAKGHLEISKVYSGLYPDRLNLTRSKWHLQQVERIDPTYCDVHQQFAHVAAQENDMLTFEREIEQAVLCPFSTGGSLPLFQRYWKMTLMDAQQRSPMVFQAVQARYNKSVAAINAAVERERQQPEKERSRTPLARH